MGEADPRPEHATGPRFERWQCMENQTSHDIWVLAIATLVVAMPILAIATLAAR
jgi:hypothetical protein